MSEGAELNKRKRVKKKKENNWTLEGLSAQEVEMFPELKQSEICCCFPSPVGDLFLGLATFSPHTSQDSSHANGKKKKNLSDEDGLFWSIQDGKK